METKDIILDLRTKKGLSQDELAELVFVTRQAVSRWENGETIPNTETLKQLSKLFAVSINTLLGSPQQLFCQCCGMPLADSNISRETGGEFNEEYCKWCYADGDFTMDFWKQGVRKETFEYIGIFIAIITFLFGSLQIFSGEYDWKQRLVNSISLGAILCLFGINISISFNNWNLKYKLIYYALFVIIALVFLFCFPEIFL